jgi:hypothetical protein
VNIVTILYQWPSVRLTALSAVCNVATQHCLSGACGLGMGVYRWMYTEAGVCSRGMILERENGGRGGGVYWVGKGRPM